MGTNKINQAGTDSGVEEAKRIADEVELGSRHLSGWQKYLIPIIAAAWSLFQLALPKFILINSEIVRSIHLAFAICLVYLSFPICKGEKAVHFIQTKLKPISGLFISSSKIPLMDLALAIIAPMAALYLAYDYVGIGQRSGAPNTTDIILGVTLIILLLDAARRSLGLALPIISSLFILYSFFSQHMPEVIAFKNASISKVISKLSMGSEGIYGVPLDVSASTVFLFVLFGSMLDKAGGGRYFIQLAFSLLGRFKGGPAKAAVLASGLTGMVSGSSIANTVTTGTFTIPLMKKTGYPGVKAAAVEVAASTNGQLMPPIMGAAAFIIAEYCNLSYFDVVRAAFIPAVISYIALIYITHLEASKMGLRGIPKKDLPPFWATFIGGIHFLIPLGFLLYQLIIERRSAQLSAYYAILALMGLMVFKNIWGGMKLKLPLWESLKTSAIEIWDSLVAGGRNMMSIGVAVAAAGIIVGIVTLGLGGVITDLIDIISGGNLIPMLIITAVISLLLGMGLPTTANYIVMASLTAPAIVALSGDMGLEVPLIAAHLFCFYFGILADDTPPVGLAAYAAGAIAKEDPIKVGIQGFKYDMRTAILPFMFIFNTELLLHNVSGFTNEVFIFIMALIAMFAFAALTQGYLIAKNKWWDALLLFVATIILFRPGLFADFSGLDRNIWKFIGLGVYLSVFALQYPRMEKKLATTK